MFKNQVMFSFALSAFVLSAVFTLPAFAQEDGGHGVGAAPVLVSGSVESNKLESIKSNKVFPSKKSSEGVIFEIIGNENGKDIFRQTVKDKEGEVIATIDWYPALNKTDLAGIRGCEKGVCDWVGAKAACAKRGLRLPTKEEFLVAQKDGIKSMHKDFFGRFFWSSTESGHGFALGFYGDFGDTGPAFLSSAASVRCVR